MDDMVKFRVDLETKVRWKALADSMGVSLSEWVRRKCEGELVNLPGIDPNGPSRWSNLQEIDDAKCDVDIHPAPSAAKIMAGGPVVCDLTPKPFRPMLKCFNCRRRERVGQRVDPGCEACRKENQ